MVAKQKSRSSPAKAATRGRSTAIFRGGISQMTSKGQVTIAAGLRKALNLRPGDQVLMMLDDGGTVRLKRLKPLNEVIAELPKVRLDIKKNWRTFKKEGQDELARQAMKHLDDRGGDIEE